MQRVKNKSLAHHEEHEDSQGLKAKTILTTKGLSPSLKSLDSGFRRNDILRRFLTFYEVIRIRGSMESQ